MSNVYMSDVEQSYPHVEELTPATTELDVRRYLSTTKHVEAYQAWKQFVPRPMRALIEGAMQGERVKIAKEYPPLFRSFLEGFQELLQNPHIDIESLETSDLIKNLLKPLQTEQTDEETTVNIAQLLTSPDTNIDFKLKKQWYEARIVTRLNWLANQEKTNLSEDLELTVQPDDEILSPSMDDMESVNETPEGVFMEMAPFYGGVYKGHIYEIWDGDTLEWKKSQKKLTQFTASPEEIQEIAMKVIPQTTRKSWLKCHPNKFHPVDLPYDFIILPESLPDNVDLCIDEDGINYVKITHTNVTDDQSQGYDQNPTKEESVILKFRTAKLKSPRKLTKQPASQPQLTQYLPEEILQKIADIPISPKLPTIDVVRILGRFVRNHLEYSNDSSYNDIYKANPTEYFMKIWEHQQADCDVANTVAAAVLMKAGLRVQMSAGHSIQSPSKEGTAQLHSGTGHAWIEVWVPEIQEWKKFDFTPSGDPNVDEEEQEEQFEDDLDGDFMEQDAELLSDEELEGLKESLIQAEAEEAERKKLTEVRYAEEAGCTVQEAKDVLAKIAALRELTDDRGVNLFHASMDTWQQAIKKNLKETSYYTGPVRRSEGDRLEDVVSAYIDVQAKESDPSGWEKEDSRVEIEKEFGGFEVYIAADLSGSMNWIDPVTDTPKKEAQRDAVFLFVDSLMQNAYKSSLHELNLKNPMPVRVCVVIFGKKTEIVLPLTGKWGPKEQIQLYRALDQCAGGGTPDDIALDMIQTQIAKSQENESATDPKMHRFIVVLADGGSNVPQVVAQKLTDIRDEGTVAYGFGVTESGRAMEAVYQPDAITIPDVRKLAAIGIQTLINTIKKWYDI